jgi:hypothetical protein
LNTTTIDTQNYNLKIINDPIYGFITIPSRLVFDLIEDPYFQRLRRISQMGLSYLVYPGAHHTRFHHAIGAMHLMHNAIQVLVSKGVEVTQEEKEGLYVAILLHDMGHGPFSHAMENSIVNGVNHEQISLKFMEVLNKKFNNKLTLGITIFKNQYHKKYLHQLVSGQLDMDRLDYLKRDSFYTGVTEGMISSQRLISMLNVSNETLVIEEKGIYSVEKFLIARRLMYWQVYLHKTGLVAEQLLLRLLKRAKELTQEGTKLKASDALSFFLHNEITTHNLTQEVLDTFSQLDDYDIISAMKYWQHEDDYVLKTISKMLLNRDLLKIEIQKQPFSAHLLEEKTTIFRKTYNLTKEEASYFVFSGTIGNQAYDPEKDLILLQKKDKTLVDVIAASDQLNLKALSKKVIKYYMCYPKGI